MRRDMSVGEGGTYAQILAALMYLFGLWSDITYTALHHTMVLELSTC